MAGMARPWGRERGEEPIFPAQNPFSNSTEILPTELSAGESACDSGALRDPQPYLNPNELFSSGACGTPGRTTPVQSGRALGLRGLAVKLGSFSLCGSDLGKASKNISGRPISWSLACG
jgi:hypothetical protein